MSRRPYSTGFADGGAESVGESRSRVAIARAGLPPPVPQWLVVRWTWADLDDFEAVAHRLPRALS